MTSFAREFSCPSKLVVCFCSRRPALPQPVRCCRGSLGADVNSQIRMAVDRLQRPRRQPYRRLQGSPGRAVRLRSSVLGKAAEKFEKDNGRKLDQVTDFRQLLDRKDIDAISIATPNHTHSLIAHSRRAGRQGRVLREAGQPLRVGRPAAGERAEEVQPHHSMRHAGPLAARRIQGSRRVRAQRQARQDSVRHRHVLQAAARHRQARQAARRFRSTSITTCGAARRRRSICIGPSCTTIGTGTTTPATATWATRASTRWTSPAGSIGVEDALAARGQLRRPARLRRRRQLGQHASRAARLSRVPADLRNPRPAQVEGRSGELGRSMDNFKGSQIGVVVQCENGYVVSTDVVRRSAGVRQRRQGNRSAGTAAATIFENFLAAVQSRKRERSERRRAGRATCPAPCATRAASRTSWASRAPAKEILRRSSKNERLRDAVERMFAHLQGQRGRTSTSRSSRQASWLEMDPQTERFTNNQPPTKCSAATTANRSSSRKSRNSNSLHHEGTTKARTRTNLPGFCGAVILSLYP